MIQRTHNTYPQQTPQSGPATLPHKRPSSPKFGSSYGLKSPSSHANHTNHANPSQSRQVLLDQIINNCQRAQSPINKKNNNSNSNNNNNNNHYSSSQNNSGCSNNNAKFPHMKFKRNSNFIRIQTEPENSSYRDEEKQNIRAQCSSNSKERERIKHSLEKRQAYLNNLYKQPTIQDKKSSISNNLNPTTNLLKPNFYPSTTPNFQYNIPPINQQNFHRRHSPTRINTNINSPTYKFKTTLLHQLPKPKRPDSISSKKCDSFRSEQSGSYLNSEQLAMKQRIQQEKARHIENCRKQQRKLRLYYVELQNKLCDMRNKELRMLAEYQSQKLKQLDQCLYNLSRINEPTLHTIEQSKIKLDQINKKRQLRTNQNIKPQIRGCLINDINAVYFSFDQNMER